MSSIYFTADLHLGHANAIRHTDRPYADVNEMDDALINNINMTVGYHDELWILGDFSYRVDKERACALREKIYCKQIHLIYGNHDKNYDDDTIFQSVQHYKELKTEYGKVILFHYPILDWNAKHHGSIHLHGHIHSSKEYNEANRRKLVSESFDPGHTAKDEALNLRMYDVGVDANDYRPISLDQIAEFFGIAKVSN